MNYTSRNANIHSFGTLSANRTPPTCGCMKIIVGGERRLKCRTIRISRTIRIRISRTTRTIRTTRTRISRTTRTIRTTRTRISRTTTAESFKDGEVALGCEGHLRDSYNFGKLYEFLNSQKKGHTPLFLYSINRKRRTKRITGIL